MSSYELVPFDASHRDEYIRLLAEAWGNRGLSPEEFEWWFERNPAGSILRTALVDGQVAGVGAHMLARMVIGGEERRVSFSCHAVTSPAASGRGIFTELQRALDQAAQEQGIELVLGFGNEVTNPVFFGRLVRRELGRAHFVEVPSAALKMRRACVPATVSLTAIRSHAPESTSSNVRGG